MRFAVALFFGAWFGTLLAVVWNAPGWWLLLCGLQLVAAIAVAGVAIWRE